jgi:hypothetical protein
MRDVILRELQAPNTNHPVFAEIIGVRLLLVNVLRPLVTGQRLSPETFDNFLNQISTAKHELARKLSARQDRELAVANTRLCTSKPGCCFGLGEVV